MSPNTYIFCGTRGLFDNDAVGTLPDHTIDRRFSQHLQRDVMIPFRRLKDECDALTESGRAASYYVLEHNKLSARVRVKAEAEARGQVPQDAEAEARADAEAMAEYRRSFSAITLSRKLLTSWRTPIHRDRIDTATPDSVLLVELSQVLAFQFG